MNAHNTSLKETLRFAKLGVRFLSLLVSIISIVIACFFSEAEIDFLI